MTEFHHVSVLLEECIDGLNIKPDGIYVDGTLGGAGHSSRIAAKLTTGRLIGIDRDEIALDAAARRLEPYKDRVTLVHSNFCEIASVLKQLNIDGVDGVLLDLGVSSPQLDDGSRGGRVQEMLYRDGACVFEWRPVRPIPKDDDFFENVWREYRETGNVG